MCDPDARRYLDFKCLPLSQATHLQGAGHETGSVQLPRDSQRQRELARTSREIFDAPCRRPPPLHRHISGERLQCADQHAARLSFWLSHKVQALVHAVNEVDVSVPRRSKQDPRSVCDSTCRVRRQIGGTQVRLHFDDLSSSAAMDQHSAQAIASYFNSWSIIEVSRKQIRSGNQFRKRDFTFA